MLDSQVIIHGHTAVHKHYISYAVILRNASIQETLNYNSSLQ